MARGDGVTEFTTTVVRFNQAVNRLEVLREIKEAPEKLFVRMTKKCKVWNMVEEVNGKLHNFRFTDLGPA